jgi:hypothetical protein
VSAANGSAPPQPLPESPLGALVVERPELAVGAAFVGGVILAMLIRRLGN